MKIRLNRPAAISIKKKSLSGGKVGNGMHSEQNNEVDALILNQDNTPTTVMSAISTSSPGLGSISAPGASGKWGGVGMFPLLASSPISAVAKGGGSTSGGGNSGISKQRNRRASAPSQPQLLGLSDFDPIVSPSGNSFMCPVEGCGKMFARKFNLKTHMNTHDPARARPFLCPDPNCNKTFVRFHDLDRHQTVHSKTKEFTCACGVSFTRKDAKNRHIRQRKCAYADAEMLSTSP